MREPGFYWVRRESWSGEPEVAHYDGEAFYPCGDDRCAMEDSDDPVQVLSERLVPPGAPPKPVTCYVCDEPADLMDAYKRAALIGKQLPKGGRVELDGLYCKMILRNPKQRSAKAAHPAAKSRARLSRT
jgi:hypothetical protein